MGKYRLTKWASSLQHDKKGERDRNGRGDLWVTAGLALKRPYSSGTLEAMRSVQFPQYEGSEGKAEQVGGWTTHALTERPAKETEGEPGAQYGSNVAMLPVHQVAKYREYDRAGANSHGEHSQKTIAGIADDLRKGGPTAMREPIWIDYDHNRKWGYISEGNHRVEAAIQAGVSHIPVRIGRGSGVESRQKKGLGGPLHLDNRLVEGRGGYLPSELHPGNFQEFEGHR